MRTRNLLFLTGNVGQDPRQVGKTVKLNVATNRDWIDKAGAPQSARDWVTVTFFEGRTAAAVMAQARKGARVSIEAHVADTSYADKSGQTIFSTDVIGDRFDLIHSAATDDRE